MNRPLLLSFAALLWLSAGNPAVASLQIKSMTRGVSTDLTKLESSAYRSTSGMVSHPLRSLPKERGIYYFEMTHSVDNLTGCDISYAQVSGAIQTAGKAATHRHTPASKLAAAALGGKSQTWANSIEFNSNNTFGYHGSFNTVSPPNSVSHRDGQNNGNSFQPGNSNNFGSVGGSGYASVPAQPGNNSAEAVFTSSSTQSYQPVLRGNDSVAPAAVVPEVSAIVTWAILSPFGALAFTSRRSRRTR